MELQDVIVLDQGHFWVFLGLDNTRTKFSIMANMLGHIIGYIRCYVTAAGQGYTSLSILKLA